MLVDVCRWLLSDPLKVSPRAWHGHVSVVVAALRFLPAPAAVEDFQEAHQPVPAAASAGKAFELVLQQFPAPTAAAAPAAIRNDQRLPPSALIARREFGEQVFVRVRAPF